MAKNKERAVYYRAVRFGIFPTETQQALLLRISEVLRTTWNEALEPRMAALAAWRAVKESGVKTEVKFPTLFDQINALTTRREGDATFAYAPRNWQEETLDRLNGSFLSFAKLVKNNDKNARPPRARDAGFFQVIPGRFGFSVKGGRVHFAPNLFGKGVFEFAVPGYCQEKVEEGKIKKFTLSRDEPNLAKPGQFWLSIVYEVPQPALIPVTGDERVYIALGASSIGVVTKAHEIVMPLWRPDKHWKERIASVEKRLENPKLKKGSKHSTKLWSARRRMFELMRQQQRQNHREMVRTLLGFGKHFVVSDYVVRSKPGKLADRKDGERGGSHGLNWAAQNTGSFLDLLMVLEERVKEVGGSVTKMKLPPPPRGIGRGSENKVPMARHVRQTFLES